MNTSVRVAIACCRSAAGAGPDDLYPDIDGLLLQAAFDHVGIDAALVAWDDPREDWSSFRCVLLRSTWDSVDRPDDFLAWTRRVASVTTLLNPLAAVETTLDKHYLVGLETLGVVAPKTQFLEPEGDVSWVAPANDFVIKPAISGGGRETALYRGGEQAAAGRHVRRLGECRCCGPARQHRHRPAGRRVFAVVDQREDCVRPITFPS